MNPNVKTSLPLLILHGTVSSINGASSFAPLHYHFYTIDIHLIDIHHFSLKNS